MILLTEIKSTRVWGHLVIVWDVSVIFMSLYYFVKTVCTHLLSQGDCKFLKNRVISCNVCITTWARMGALHIESFYSYLLNWMKIRALLSYSQPMLPLGRDIPWTQSHLVHLVDFVSWTQSHLVHLVNFVSWSFGVSHSCLGAGAPCSCPVAFHRAALVRPPFVWPALPCILPHLTTCPLCALLFTQVCGG